MRIDDKEFPSLAEFRKIPERQGYKCALSGVPINPKRSSLDHRNPRSLGGSNNIENLQIVLPMINRAKGTMSQDQFVAMCHAVAHHLQDSGDTTWISGVID